MIRRRFLPALALLLAAGAAPLAAQQPVTVFVVRHAEKGPETPDPSLTPEGVARAEALARVLAGAGVTHFYASEFKRTRETVAPAAAQAGATPTVVPARDLDGLVSRLRALPAGSRALVASHSNLVHLIAARLSGVQVPELTELDYDRLVVVTLLPGGGGEAVVLRYGAPSGGVGAGSMKP